MTLFFYGAVELKGDREGVCDSLAELAHRLGLSLKIDQLFKEYSIEVLFRFPEDRERDFLAFELDFQEDDPLVQLFGRDIGSLLDAHYREVARSNGVSNWLTSSLSSSPEVEEAYLRTPLVLPATAFVEQLIQAFPDREIVISFDEGFENRFACRDVVGDERALVLETWKVIALGYSWPNLRMRYQQHEA